MNEAERSIKRERPRKDSASLSDRLPFHNTALVYRAQHLQDCALYALLSCRARLRSNFPRLSRPAILINRYSTWWGGDSSQHVEDLVDGRLSYHLKKDNEPDADCLYRNSNSSRLRMPKALQARKRRRSRRRSCECNEVRPPQMNPWTSFNMTWIR